MAPPKLECISLTSQDGIGLIKYNVPKANALSTQMMSDIVKALKWALEDSTVRVIVITGEGRFFTAGLQLAGTPPGKSPLTDEGIELLREIHATLINAPKVIIAAVNGPGVGWGTTSIALCDLVYSVPDATFFTPFASLGICAEACSSLTFTRIMGRQKAASLLLAGDRLTPDELERAGLISKVLPKEGFMEEVMKIAKRIAAQPLEALNVNKGLMMQPLRRELLDANERECAELYRRTKSKEHIDAVAAFEAGQQSKKKPQQSSKL